MPRSIVVNQTPSTGHVQDDDVRERANEVRVARAEHVLRHLVQLVEGGGVGAARRAAERLRVLGVEHVEDEVGVGVVVDEDEAVCLEGLADRAHPRLVGRRGRRSPDRVLSHGASVTRRRAGPRSGAGSPTFSGRVRRNVVCGRRRSPPRSCRRALRRCRGRWRVRARRRGRRAASRRRRGRRARRSARARPSGTPSPRS